MKKSVSFLPETKQEDLQQLVGLILANINDVGMIILFGSYAKNKFVGYDQKVEFDVPTYYMSDYDIVILTRKKMGAIQHSLFTKIKDQFFEDKNRKFYTHPQFLTYGIEDFNHALTKGHYFETEIKRDGIVLYDSGEYKLARRRKLKFDEIEERAEKYYEDKYGRALSFLRSARHDVEDKDILMASFHLHQATENFLRTISLVFILYSPKDHDLEELINTCKEYAKEIFRVFPRDTPNEERLFDLLQRAYIESRYNPDFEITKEDIDALMPKIELLRDITEKVCRERIEYYRQQAQPNEKV